jgi:hypothetical protein
MFASCADILFLIGPVDEHEHFRIDGKRGVGGFG